MELGVGVRKRLGLKIVKRRGYTMFEALAFCKARVVRAGGVDGAEGGETIPLPE